jgi:lipoprotein-anchoring transpeptidase ErfK/SrfK
MGAWSLAACTAVETPKPQVQALAPVILVPDAPEPFTVEPVDISGIDRRYWRQSVPDPTGEPAGTLVIDPDARFLWLVMEDGRAMRYGVGVGRDGFAWNGEARMNMKREWPKWTPPPEMIERQPEAAQWANGMPGGPENPLGARALYLFADGRDTLYRIHGTAEPWSIGRAVSSGCVRLLNADVIDLYRRVPLGARVVVRPSAGMPPLA